MPPKRKAKTTPRKYAKPLSLHSMNFVEAVDKLITAKPKATVKRKKA